MYTAVPPGPQSRYKTFSSPSCPFAVIPTPIPWPGGGDPRSIFCPCCSTLRWHHRVHVLCVWLLPLSSYSGIHPCYRLWHCSSLLISSAAFGGSPWPGPQPLRWVASRSGLCPESCSEQPRTHPRVALRLHFSLFFLFIPLEQSCWVLWYVDVAVKWFAKGLRCSRFHQQCLHVLVHTSTRDSCPPTPSRSETINSRGGRGRRSCLDHLSL